MSADRPAGVEELPILYRDDAVVVVDKPSGLLVHRSPIDRHETRFAVQLLRDQLGRRVYPVHRLDKGTSGALAFVLDRDTATSLAAQFADKQVRKTYLAIVRGWPPAQGVIDHPLDAVQDPYAPTADTGPKPCRTSYRTLATVELQVRVDRYPTSRYALVELEPETGRRHQLRRHLAHSTHPIIGDSTYGKGRHNRLFAERFGVRRLLLACVRLEFDDVSLGRTAATNSAVTEIRRLDYIYTSCEASTYTSWNNHSMGSAFTTKRFLTDALGNVRATIDSEVQWSVNPQAGRGTKLCKGTFTTVRPFR